MFDDTYKTIRFQSKGYYSEKGSRFIALAFPVTSEEEAKQHLAETRKTHYDARHHCYAYLIGHDRSAYRVNDDGEPSGSAGRVIHGQLLSNDITNVLVIVVRYFGGTKLGIPGLINAYKTATKEAIIANEIIEKTIDETYRVSFDYFAMNSVMQILKQDCIKINSQEYDTQYIISFTIRRSRADQVVGSLRKVEGVELRIER